MVSYHDGSVTIYQGHVLDVLAQLPAESVHCVVTSPPYWGLRDYDVPPQVWPATWSGGCLGQRGRTISCTILDPFSGAGTVALVAKKLGRLGLGIELKPEYIDLAARRMPLL